MTVDKDATEKLRQLSESLLSEESGISEGSFRILYSLVSEEDQAEMRQSVRCEDGRCFKDHDDQIFGDEPDVSDDFPMSLEYDGLWGAPDYLVEETAQRESEFESGFFEE